MPKDRKRSAAAKKGWETRRKNAKPEKQYDRSAAAKKGWQTRRAKQQAREYTEEYDFNQWFDEYTEQERVKDLFDALEEQWEKDENDESDYYDWYDYYDDEEEEYSPREDDDLEEPDEYSTPTEDLVRLGEAIDDSIRETLSNVTTYENMAQATMTELNRIRTELGKDYYMNLAENWSNIQGHLYNIQADYKAEGVYESESKLVAYASGNLFNVTSFQADLKLARRLDMRSKYHREHPNAKYRKT